MADRGVVRAAGLAPGAGLWAVAVASLALPEPGPWRIWPMAPVKGWAVWEVDPESLASREILDHRGEVLCGVTSAAKVGDRDLIGSMNESRVVSGGRSDGT